MDLSSCADDVDPIQVRPTPTAIAERVNFSNEVFTSVLARIGMAQNVGKQDHMVCYKKSAQLSSVSGYLPLIIPFAWKDVESTQKSRDAPSL